MKCGKFTFDWNENDVTSVQHGGSGDVDGVAPESLFHWSKAGFSLVHDADYVEALIIVFFKMVGAISYCSLVFEWTKERDLCLDQSSNSWGTPSWILWESLWHTSSSIQCVLNDTYFLHLEVIHWSCTSAKPFYVCSPLLPQWMLTSLQHWRLTGWALTNGS